MCFLSLCSVTSSVYSPHTKPVQSSHSCGHLLLMFSFLRNSKFTCQWSCLYHVITLLLVMLTHTMSVVWSVVYVDFIKAFVQ